LIFNPAAGKIRRNPELILQRTIEALRGVSLKPRVLTTRGPGEATALANQAIAEGADLVLVFGGDGTINEAANGMVNSRVPLAALPGGTANVLTMELGLGNRLERAIERLEDCVERRVALGRLTDARGASRYFLMMGGAGLDAKIVYDLNPDLKARTGKLAYWVTGFSQIAHPLEEFEVKVGGEVYRCGFALAARVCNYGGDLAIACGASLTSDEFEIVLFEGANPLRYAWYMLGVLGRRVQSMRGVRTLRARSVQLAGSVHLQIDGEYAGRSPACFEIGPGTLTLLMPPTYG
jgi:YegS/Rv2252/BmrU family lipid kinase